MSRKKVVETIEKSKSIAILPHIYSDGDAYGSSLALAIALQKINKEIDLIFEENMSSYYDFLPGRYLIKTNIEKIGHDLVIALDSGDICRLGARVDVFTKGKISINIDHHQTNTNFADINYVHEMASSTGEMLYDVIYDLGIKMDINIAICLYVAISTDTGGFKYSNTSYRTHEIIAKLMKTGINISTISRKLYDLKPLKKVKLMGKMLATLKVVEDGSICFAYITKEMLEETGTTLDDTDQMVNICLNIEGVRVAFLIKYQDENHQKVTLRAFEGFDVAKIAGKYCGGGHAKAAGFRSSNSIEELEKILLSEIKKGT